MLMVFLVGVLFLVGEHPLMGVILLMVVTLLYFFIIYMKMSVLWFGLILMLVMLSGVLVLFTYMASLTPDEKFEFKMLWGAVGFLMFMLNFDLFDIGLLEDVSFNVLKLWNFSVISLNLFMLGVLLLVMLVVTNIVSCFKGAVRVECEG